MASADPELAERVVDLEIKLVYQDQLVRELDALVRAFGVRIDELTRELRALKDGVRSPEVALGPGNEPPPHY